MLFGWRSGHAINLIDSVIYARPARRIAISESISSDFNGLRRHFRVGVIGQSALNLGSCLRPAAWIKAPRRSFEGLPWACRKGTFQGAN
jgi:hypothetical protein